MFRLNLYSFLTGDGEEMYSSIYILLAQVMNLLINGVHIASLPFEYYDE